MLLNLSPSGEKPRITYSRKGDIITVDGEGFDFSFLGEGDTLPREAVSGGWLMADATRIDGVLCLTIGLPHGQNAPHETRFPEPIAVTQDGPIELPPYDAPEVSE